MLITVDDIIIHVEEVANDVSVVVVRWILLCPEYTQNGRDRIRIRFVFGYSCFLRK